MDIMNGLTAVSKAIDIARALKGIEGHVNDATFKLQIAELHSALADAKIALADAREELASKESEIKRLNEIQGSKMRVVAYKGYNFGIDVENTPIGRPFCPICEQKQNLQVQLVRGSSTHDLCPSCKGIYADYPRKLQIKLITTV